MNDSQITRTSLLIRLKGRQDNGAWAEFLEIYTPAVYGYFQRRGLQDADAADVTQDVLRTVARSIRGFDCDRSKGSFRAWLFTVVRSRLNDFFAIRQRQQSGTGDTATLEYLEEQPNKDDAEDVWEQEYRRGLFDWAVSRVRNAFEESTWQAFWQTGVEGKDTKQVATALGISEGAVYVAKCRVLARVRAAIRAFEDEH